MDRMDNIAFQGQLTEADYHKINGLGTRKIVRFFYGVNALIFLLLAIPYLHDLLYFLIHFSPIFLIFVGVILIGYLQVHYAWKKNRIVQMPFNGFVSEDAITWNVENVSSNSIGWHLLLHYRSSKSIVVVYMGVNQILYFLPRFFASEADWLCFRDLLSKKLRRK
jgi:hypothetical protein